MNAAALHPGVVVKANKLGREFRARLTGKPAGGRVPVEPLDRHVTYRELRTGEIREVVADPAQPQLEGIA